jgi:hypothetical protein
VNNEWVMDARTRLKTRLWVNLYYLDNRDLHIALSVFYKNTCVWYGKEASNK